MNKHKMRLDSSAFSKIASSEKDIELRIYDKKRRKVKEGDFIKFTNRETGEVVNTKVITLHLHSNFEELLGNIDQLRAGWEAVIPVNEAAEMMYKYYSKEEEKKYGVVGIEIILLLKD